MGDSGYAGVRKHPLKAMKRKRNGEEIDILVINIFV